MNCLRPQGSMSSMNCAESASEIVRLRRGRSLNHCSERAPQVVTPRGLSGPFGDRPPLRRTITGGRPPGRKMSRPQMGGLDNHTGKWGEMPSLSRFRRLPRGPGLSNRKTALQRAEEAVGPKVGGFSGKAFFEGKAFRGTGLTGLLKAAHNSRARSLARLCPGLYVPATLRLSVR